jgi:arginine N-succinyltransferase
MYLVRPIANTDLSALVHLAEQSGAGMTTLPPEEAQLRKRIEASNASFAGTAAKADEFYMFVLVDTGQNGEGERVVGTAALVAAVGLRQAFYSYRVGLTVHASEELGIYTKAPTLFLSNDYTGCSELCSLFLAPRARKNRNGALLSKSRMMFIAQFRERFARQTIAELRGYLNEHGRSPFWDCVGLHFFSMEFARADYLTGIGKKSFVAELMPKHPLYVTLLSREAQAAIGQTHLATAPARAMLENEGFRYTEHVDIFDAGPAVECDTDNIGVVRASSLVRAVEAHGEPAGKLLLVGNTRFADFRCALATGQITPDGVTLPAEVMAGLGVREGDTVRAVPLLVGERG